MAKTCCTLTRREFARITAGAIAGMAAGPLTAGANTSITGTVRTPTVATAVLGRTGVEVSQLGIGASPFRGPSITNDDVHAILHRGLELGVTFIDVAPEYAVEQYGSYAEAKIGVAMNGIRDKYFVATKTEEATYEGTWRLLRQSMKHLQTDYLDLVHLHNLGQESRFPDLDFVFSDKGALGALREAKRQGAIRFIGASGHLFPSRFHAGLDTGEIDVLMNAVNFVVQHTYRFESRVWPRARGENVGLVAMKVLGGAPNNRDKYSLPEELYEQSIRYAVTIPGMACAVIGVKTVSELEQLAQTFMRVKPLSDKEAHELSEVGRGLATTSQWRAPYGTPLA